MNVDRLVEQARGLLRDELWMHSNDEQDEVVAGLADEVERLQRERDKARDAVPEYVKSAMKLVPVPPPWKPQRTR